MSATAHVIHIEGDLSIRNAPSLARELREALAAHAALAVDARALTSVDISIVQVLVAAHKTAQQQGRRLRVEGAGAGPLGEVLRRGGLVPETGAAADRTLWDGDAWIGLHIPQPENAA
jgi:ABC-type transporter Mla MlaB component